MSDSAIVPVIAGLTVGIGFVLLFAAYPVLSGYYLSSGPFPDPAYYEPLIQLKITGLKESYNAGERVNFAVTQKAAGCVFPELVVVQNLETGNVVWQFNGTQANRLLFGCISMADDPASSRMTMNTLYEDPIIINQTGSYMVEARLKHMTVEQQFTVIQ
ncbi:MAG: hypothetical protein AB1351_12555 [Thermoproteota archaeon]